jgi:hypothetical protein
LPPLQKLQEHVNNKANARPLRKANALHSTSIRAIPDCTMIQAQCQKCSGLDEFHSSNCLVRTLIFGESSIHVKASQSKAMEAAILAIQTFLNRDIKRDMSATIIPFGPISGLKGKRMNSVNAKSESVHGNLDLERLKEPFKESEVEFRLSQSGERDGMVWALSLAYITSRAIMDRLDSVCGPANWKVAYEFIGATGVVCNLSIFVNGEWITKQDGAEMTHIESFKGGISSALKRAGSAWGMGRYLYSLEATFVQECHKNTPGALYGKTKNGREFYWAPPKLPAWALPKAEKQEAKPPQNTSPTNSIQNSESQPIVTTKRVLSENQIKRLYAISNSVGLNRVTIDATIKNKYGCSPIEMTYADYRYITDEYLPQLKQG